MRIGVGTPKGWCKNCGGNGRVYFIDIIDQLTDLYIKSEQDCSCLDEEIPIWELEMTLKIYGSSDDLIEIAGDFIEEFGHYSDDPAYLAFSDGTVLRCEYDGYWRFALHSAGSAGFKFTPAADTNDGYCNSDIIELQGTFRWVVFGKEFNYINNKTK